MSALGRAVFEGVIQHTENLPGAPQARLSLIEQVRNAPLHDFPIRDEILRQFVFFAPDMEVMEVGPGAGFTAHWLARSVRQLMLVDATSDSVQKLQTQFGKNPNVDVLQWNLAKPGLAATASREFDIVFGLDVFEYIPDAAAGFRNLADVLRTDGVLLLTFPNTPPPEGDGVTYFHDAAELETLLKGAGFRGVEIFTVRLNTFAGWVYALLHEWPLAMVRKLRKRRSWRPQTYESTWTFRSGRRLAAMRPVLNLMWFCLDGLMRLGGDFFTENNHGLGIIDRQLVIRAWK